MRCGFKFKSNDKSSLLIFIYDSVQRQVYKLYFSYQSLVNIKINNILRHSSNYEWSLKIILQN